MTGIPEKGHIGFVCSSASWGGLEMNIVRLAGWLKERGWPITLFGDPGTPLSARALESGIDVVGFSPRRKYLDLASARRLRGHLREHGILTAFVFHRDDLDLMSWVRVFSGPRLKLLYQQHMQLGISRRDPFHTFRYSRYDAWISPLEYLRAEVLSGTRLPAAKVRLIPLGIDTGKYTGLPLSRAEARKHFSLGEDGRLFGILGRFDPGKRQMFAVEMLKALRSRGHDVHLLLVGSPTLEREGEGAGRKYLADLQETIRSLGLEAHVHLRPFEEDNRIFFRAVDACIMATPAETYGMVTLEAMASGTPVIGTDAGGTREILQGGKLGLLYRPDDGGDFIAKSEIFLNGGYGGGMIEEARDRVREAFTHARECDLIEQLIAELHRGGIT